MNKSAYVYLLTNSRNNVLYTGVTSDLTQRIWQHKNKTFKGFTAQYNVNKLVWFIAGENIESAIKLEKKIKNRERSWKVKLIEKTNPNWRDLSEDFLDSATDKSAQNDKSRTADNDESSSSSCAKSQDLGRNDEILRFATRTQNDEVLKASKGAK